MKTLFIGIDPGKSGGIALIDTEENIAITAPYSDKELIDLLKEASPGRSRQEVVCCLEKVGAMPGQGVVSMFSIPYQEITPQKWKREFGLTSDKAKSAEVCRKLFPDVSLLATPRCKKPHDGMAEALLMAEYARRKL